jgi:hypothetical protein
MELKDFIDTGAEKRGSIASLARYLDQGETALRDARKKKRGLPAYACIKLAEYIGVEPIQVIAASELVTEKREERREIFQRFLGGAKAGIFMLTVLLATAGIYDKSIIYAIYII